MTSKGVTANYSSLSAFSYLGVKRRSKNKQTKEIKNVKYMKNKRQQKAKEKE